MTHTVLLINANKYICMKIVPLTASLWTQSSNLVWHLVFFPPVFVDLVKCLGGTSLLAITIKKVHTKQRNGLGSELTHKKSQQQQPPTPTPLQRHETETNDHCGPHTHTHTYRPARFASFFSFLAAALSGFALALLSFLIFFFSPCVNLSLLTKTFFSCCFTMIDMIDGYWCGNGFTMEKFSRYKWDRNDSFQCK